MEHQLYLHILLEFELLIEEFRTGGVGGAPPALAKTGCKSQNSIIKGRSNKR